MEQNREIYISNFEIKSIKFIKNPKATNTQSLAIDPAPDQSIIKIKTPTEKVAEPNNNNSLENNIWDKTNSEFEISNSNISNPVVQSEEMSRKKIQEPFSVVSLVALILSPFTFGIGLGLSLIFSIVSLSTIRKNPEKYKGRKLARIVLGISLAVLLISVSLLLLLIAAFL